MQDRQCRDYVQRLRRNSSSASHLQPHQPVFTPTGPPLFIPQIRSGGAAHHPAQKRGRRGRENQKGLDPLGASLCMYSHSSASWTLRINKYTPLSPFPLKRRPSPQSQKRYPQGILNRASGLCGGSWDTRGTAAQVWEYGLLVTKQSSGYVGEDDLGSGRRGCGQGWVSLHASL